MDFQILAKGIALAGCAIGAGCSLIAGLAIDIDSINVIERFVGNFISPTTQVTETKSFPGKLNGTFLAYPGK